MGPATWPVGRFIGTPWRVYVLTCAVVAIIVFGRAYEWDRAVRVFDHMLRPKLASSATEDNNRKIFLDNDPYYWITFARQMVITGDWRIRYTHADNVPYGREVHWSQSIAWLLVGFGYIRHLATGEPLLTAIEGGSIWVNPSLLVLSIIGFTWLISKRAGVVAGTFFALTLASLPDIGWAFHPYRPGHHGLHLAFSLGSALCLILGGLGWVTKQRTEVSAESPDQSMRFFRPLQLMDVQKARRYFAAAGIFTGLGLWIGATVECFTIGAIVVGAVLLVFFMPSQLTDKDTDYVPELWRAWGIWASIIAIATYLIEYFPAHLAMRLEVNNPLYVVTVVCIGELMVQLTRWRSGGKKGLLGRFKVLALAGGVALVPSLILFGPAQWHNMRDAEMTRLHNFITEFYTYTNFNTEMPVAESFFQWYGVLLLFPLGALALAGARWTRLYEWAALWISFSLCLFFLLLTLWQVRWAGWYAATSTWLMVIVGHIAWRNILGTPAAKRTMIFGALFSGLVLAQAALFTAREFVDLSDTCQGKTIKRAFIDAAMSKYLAEGLRDGSRDKPMRVICEPALAPALYYFGGIQTVTSLYWENVQGLHDATAFFTDHGDMVARQIAERRGLTHVIVSPSDQLPAQFNYIMTASTSINDAQPTLLARLYPNRSEVPPWIILDRGLTRIGRREFNLTTPQGTIPLQGLMTIYQLQPTGLKEDGMKTETSVVR